MKNKILAIVLASSIAGTASAQMAFQSGVIDFSYADDQFAPGVVSLGFGGRADYDIGSFGVQLDGSANVLTDFTNSFSVYSVGIHVNKTLNNGTKLGGFAGVDTISLFGLTDNIYNIGAEAMMSFGAADVEVAIVGLFADNLGDANWRAKIDVYYGISRAFEVSLGVNYWLDGGPGAALFTIGADYQLPNMPISIGAKYYFVDGFDRLEFVASYEFGNPDNQRLFQKRVLPFFFGA